MRTVWECLKVGRAKEKELKKSIKEEMKKELEAKDREISRLEQIIKDKDALISQQDQEIAHLKGAAAAARKQAAIARKEAHIARKEAQIARKKARQELEAKAFWRRQQLRQERQRNERYRLRDPIHIYALSSGTGTEKNDWTLVLDYHKGAHDIKLGHIGTDGSHALEITENESVFLFDLIVPKNVATIGALPIVPRKLCADF